MTNCIIHPIPLFEFDIEKSLFTYRLDFGQVATGVGYVWYIEGTKERMLVDAGGDSDYMVRVRGLPARKIQTLDSGLSKLGISLGDIDLVILTHLHHDHVAQASRYPKARFLVQKDELEFAQNPHPATGSLYSKQFFDGLNFEVVDGDTEVCEEVSVLKTPGHTPGGQSVSIKTAQGIVIISGLCTIRENFEPPSSFPLPITPPGAHVNLLEAYDNVLRIKEMADIVVPIHEPTLRDIRSIP